MLRLKTAWPVLLQKPILLSSMKKIQEVNIQQVLKQRTFSCSAVSTYRTCMTYHCSALLCPKLHQSCLPLSSCLKIHTRALFSMFRSPRTAKDYLRIDGIDSHYELVYHNSLINYLRLGLGGIQAIAVAALSALIGEVVGIISVGDRLQDLLVSPIESGVFVTVNLLIAAGIFKMVLSCPYRMYYSDLEDQFIAVFVGVHPLTTRHIKLQSGTVKPKRPSWIAESTLPWCHCIYLAPSQELILYIEKFSYPMYFNKLLGYTKSP